ncbi:MAG: cell division protein SepF [Defluviitaleaceae bacterium]|nr:cell division protein SepF [Defluviitaleaceae bacterium]
MALLKKVQNFMMGVAYDDEDYVENDGYVDEYVDEEPTYNKYSNNRYERTSFADLHGNDSQKKYNEEVSNVITMPRIPQGGRNTHICKPKTIEEAAAVCKQFRDNTVCVVTLEGIPQADAQRIADLLSGACFVLDGVIERITNCVFVMSPSGFNVTSELRDQIKKSDSLFSWLPGRAQS